MRKFLLFVLTVFFSVVIYIPKILIASSGVKVTAIVLESLTYVCQNNDCNIYSNANYKLLDYIDNEVRIITVAF